jgi:hypothetical protein
MSATSPNRTRDVFSVEFIKLDLAAVLSYCK